MILFGREDITQWPSVELTFTLLTSVTIIKCDEIEAEGKRCSSMMVLEIWSMYIVVQTAALVVVNEFHLCCIKCGPKGFPSLAPLRLGAITNVTCKSWFFVKNTY